MQGMLLASLLNRARTTRSAETSSGRVLSVVARPSPAAADALVEAHYEFIWRLLRRMGLNRSDADDATQQVFMVTLYPEPKPIQVGSERSFLYGVALNVFREFRRKHAARLRHTEERLDTQVAADSPQRTLETRETWERLQAVLSSMTDEVRAVFVLFELEGLTVPEIAAMVGIPTGTVASRLRRGRELFHEQVAALRAGLPEVAS